MVGMSTSTTARVQPGTPAGGQFAPTAHTETDVTLILQPRQRVGAMTTELAEQYGTSDEEAVACVQTYTTRHWVAHGRSETFVQLGTGEGVRSGDVLTERAEEAVRSSFDEHVRSGEAMVSFEGESFPAAAVLTCPECSTSYHEDDTMGYDDATGEVGCPGCAAKTEAAMSALYVAERRVAGTMPTAQEMSTHHADGVHSGRFNRGCPECEAETLGNY